METEAVRVAFGPRPVDEPNEARRNRAIHELEKKGTCVSRVTELHQKGQESLKCHWNGDRGARLKHAMAYLMASRDDVRGAAFVIQADFYISKTHPYVDCELRVRRTGRFVFFAPSGF